MSKTESKGKILNVVLLAATGKAGSTILKELISRGHNVTAVARNLDRLPEGLPASVNKVSDDLTDSERLEDITKGADVIVSAFGPSSNNPSYFISESYTDQLVEVTERAVTAADKNNIRLIVVGGAGSLWFSPDVTVLDSGYWPEQYVPIARSHVKAFKVLRSSDINWTYFSPPMMIQPGERTGIFRLGIDDIVVDAEGKNHISYEDYAVALVDEIESPKHERSRFTVGY